MLKSWVSIREAATDTRSELAGPPIALAGQLPGQSSAGNCMGNCLGM